MVSIPKIVGILNVTPDSFSDGGISLSPTAALTHGAQLLEAGASIVDVGAESTRPGATLLSPDEEWRRLRDVLPRLVAMADAVDRGVSIDTRHDDTAIKALDVGVRWINAVAGAVSQRVVDAIRVHHARLVIMNSCGLPADPAQVLPLSSDQVAEICCWWRGVSLHCLEQGLRPEQLILDPGIGFGKTASQSIELIRRAREIAGCGAEVLYGHSRKSFLVGLGDRPPAERDLETHAISLHLSISGVSYLRVHDVAGAMRIMKVYEMLNPELQ